MATVVCDFIQIVGDGPVTIGANVTELPFSTGGRVSGNDVASTALLLFNLKGLTTATIPVKVNNVVVGNIYPYAGANANHWYTQMVALTGTQLVNGTNEIQLESNSDSFQIKNMVCFFHQSA